MKVKEFISVFAVVFMLLLLLAGCSDEPDVPKWQKQQQEVRKNQWLADRERIRNIGANWNHSLKAKEFRHERKNHK